MAFFIPLYSTCATLCQFYSIASSALFTKNRKLWNQRKENFLYIQLPQCITLRRQKIVSLDKTAVLDTYLCIRNLYQQSSGITLYSCLRYTDRLLGALFALLVVILSEPYENQEGKIELQKKVDRRICLRENTFLAARPPSYVIFCCFFLLLPAFGLFRFYVQKIFLAQENGGLAGAPIPPVSTALISETVNETFVIL